MVTRSLNRDIFNLDFEIELVSMRDVRKGRSRTILSEYIPELPSMMPLSLHLIGQGS